MVLQLLRVKGAQPGVATQVFTKMKRRVRGRDPGRRAGPVGAGRTGSTVLMPGEGTAQLALTLKI